MNLQDAFCLRSCWNSLKIKKEGSSKMNIPVGSFIGHLLCSRWCEVLYVAAGTGPFRNHLFFWIAFFQKKLEWIKSTHIYSCGGGGLCLKMVIWVSSASPGYLNSSEIRRRPRLGCFLAAHWRLCILCCHLANVESFLPALAVQPGSVPCLSSASAWDITSCNYVKMLANITSLL